VGPVSHVALLGLAARHARHSRLAAAVVAGHAAGVAALVWQEAGRPLPSRVTPVTQVLYLQGVALGGMARFLRRDRVLRWSKVAR
jgi:lipopolysaccharide export LptBFGC system permease protein LptF